MLLIAEEENDDYGCIDDARTPQQCLNKWVDNFEIVENPNCFIDSSEVDASSSHKYVIVYGGCDPKSVDVLF